MFTAEGDDCKGMRRARTAIGRGGATQARKFNRKKEKNIQKKQMVPEPE